VKRKNRGTITDPYREYERYVARQRALEDPLKWVGKKSVGGIGFAIFMVMPLVLLVTYYYFFRPWIENI